MLKRFEIICPKKLFFWFFIILRIYVAAVLFMNFDFLNAGVKLFLIILKHFEVYVLNPFPTKLFFKLN